MLTSKDLPIVCRRFDMRSGDEAAAIVSAERSLMAVGSHCGIESKPAAVVIHGRMNLKRLMDQTQLRERIDTDLHWVSGPSYEGEEIAFGVAMGAIADDKGKFDLAKTFKHKVSLWDIFPLREVAVQIALVLLMAGFIFTRLGEFKAELTDLRRENSRRIEPNTTAPQLEQQKKQLGQQVTAVYTFLGSRILWSEYERTQAKQLPPNVYLTSLQGVAELGSDGKKSKRGATRKSLVLSRVCQFPESIDTTRNRPTAERTQRKSFAKRRLPSHRAG